MPKPSAAKILTTLKDAHRVLRKPIRVDAAADTAIFRRADIRVIVSKIRDLIADIENPTGRVS